MLTGLDNFSRKNDFPLISVIVPIYNVEPYIRKCLNSIITQTYRNLEIILVDDGSTDSCGLICDDYAARDSRIKAIHKQNGGVSSARNAGLRAATGEYIGWVDPDDWIEPDMFEYLLSNALAYSTDITVCGRVEQYPQKTVFKGWKEVRLLDTGQALEQLLIDKEMGSYLWDKLWKAELFDGVAFPIGRTFEDISIMHRLFKRAEKILCLPEAKYNYLQRTNSIVGNQLLTARINRYIADKTRYDQMLEEFPQFADILEAKCMEAAMNVWNTFCDSPEAQRKEFVPRLEEIAAFSKQHCRHAFKKMELGITGKITVLLTPYARLWAFRMAKGLKKLYLIKNPER